MTFAEVKLWGYLRRNELGVRFRRQHPIGPYIADFAALVPRVIVETDGYSHHREQAGDHDEQRDRWLTSQGWTVLRFPDEEVWNEFDYVARRIATTVEMLCTEGSERDQ